MKDHPEDIRSFELHCPASSTYPITLVAHKDPVKVGWLKEIRQYASDVVALAEHAADDLQLTEVPEPKEEIKANPGPKKEGNPGPKKEGNPGPEEKAVEKRANPSNPEDPESKKAKVEEETADMSRRYSSSRYSSSAKVVEGRK